VDTKKWARHIVIYDFCWRCFVWRAQFATGSLKKSRDECATIRVMLVRVMVCRVNVVQSSEQYASD
jgi:hypothetical protein